MLNAFWHGSLWQLADHSSGHKAKAITPSIARRREALREEALDDLLWEVESGPSSVRRTLEPFQSRHWEKGSERRIGAHMRISVRIDTILNWTEPFWTSGYLSIFTRQDRKDSTSGQRKPNKLIIQTTQENACTHHLSFWHKCVRVHPRNASGQGTLSGDWIHFGITLFIPSGAVP